VVFGRKFGGHWGFGTWQDLYVSSDAPVLVGKGLIWGYWPVAVKGREANLSDIAAEEKKYRFRGG